MNGELFYMPSDALIGDVGTTFNLPNYEGALFSASRRTTFLNLIGGINSGLKTNNKELLLHSFMICQVLRSLKFPKINRCKV